MIIGFTASKKVGNAVARNFAKRRMRMATRAIIEQQFYAEPGAEKIFLENVFIFIAKKSLLEADFDALLKVKSFFTYNDDIMIPK